MVEAQFYQVTPEGKVSCELCPQSCKISQGQSGFCKVRRHEDGKLLARNYGLVSSIALDPIEKKPLYHFYPGKPILSVGTIGCNLACEFCQNWHISREEAPTRRLTAGELVELAKKTHTEQGNIGLAYTYSEPTIWYEFLLETMPLIHEEGLKNVLVTNAFLNPEPWKELLKWTDAANIDLKGFEEAYYQRLCHGKLQPVLNNIMAAAGKIHLELTTLLIPGENDHPEQVEKLARWVAALDPEIPLHLSRYYPNYHLNQPPTPEETMERAFQTARQFLKFVYLGNIGVANATHCPDCGTLWVERNGYHTLVVANLAKCPGCNRKVTSAMEESVELKRNIKIACVPTLRELLVDV
jgi:pyruvate formate lyase activating enzyme